MVGEVLRTMEVERLGKAIERLPERVRYVLVRRYGLDGRDPATLAKLGKELGITRERIRQLQIQGEKDLKTTELGDRSQMPFIPHPRQPPVDPPAKQDPRFRSK